MVGSVALALGATDALTLTLAVEPGPWRATRTLRLAIVAVALVVPALGFTPLGSSSLLGAMTMLLLGLVTLSVRGWLDRLGVAE